MVDTNAISIQSLEIYYGVNARSFNRQYKTKLSGFSTWNKKAHALDYLIYPKNIGEQQALDETALSDGELYTILSNKLKGGKQRSIVGIFKELNQVKSSLLLRKIFPYRQENELRK